MAQPPNRIEESRRRPGFWTHPAYYRPQHHAGEEPLLSNHQVQAVPSANHVSRSRSLIPWSPGQTLGETMEFGFPDGVGNPMEESHEEDDEERSTSCCSNFLSRWVPCRWCCCRCCSRQPDHSSGELARLQPSLSHDSRRISRSGGGCCMKLLHVLLVVATLGGLYYYTSRSSHQSWTMNPGESRHVATAGFLTDSVQVISTTPSPGHNHHNNNNNETIARGMAVYALGSPHCPPLTGPPVTLKSPPQEIILLHNAFEYQYFYLNKGSTMEVTVHQTKGATNILVLKGNKVLARIQDKNKDPMYKEDGQDVFFDFQLDFNMEQVVVERFSGMQEHAPIEFSFTSPANDVYVLLYDNAATNEPAAFNVSYRLVLTTYDLEGLQPWCSHLAPVEPASSQETYFTCPPLQVATAGCIIVEAVEHHDDSHNSTIDNVFQVDGGVEVTLNTTRRWTYIGGLSVIPSALLALVCWYRRRKRRRTRSRHREQHYYHHHQSMPPHHQQQIAREGPTYQYLPPHHHEGSEREATDHEVGMSPEEEVVSRSRHSRNLSSNFGQTTSSCPCAENEDQGQDVVTIATENVHVVVKDQEEQDDQS